MLLSMHVHFLIIIYIHILCIFSELISQCAGVRMTQFFYILIYSIHVKVYYYCLTLNCYCPISNRYCLALNCYCLDIWTVIVQPLLSSFELLLSTHWTVIIQPLLSNFELLLSTYLNCYCLHIELLLSNHYYLTLNYYCLHIELLLSNCYCLTLNCYCLHIELLLFWYRIVIVRPWLKFLPISKVIELYFKRDWSRWKAKTQGYKFSEKRRTQFYL